MTIQIGIGDSFTYQREHWQIINVKNDVFVCKNKVNGAVVEFNKETVRKYIK